MQATLACFSCGRGDAEDEPIGVRESVDVVMPMCIDELS